VQLGECHQHAGVALTQVTLQPLTMMDEGREQQTGQLGLLQAKELLGVGRRLHTPFPTAGLCDQMFRNLPATQVVHRLAQKTRHAVLVGQLAQALGLHPAQVSHQQRVGVGRMTEVKTKRIGDVAQEVAEQRG